MMAFEGELAAGNKVYLGIWKIALECLGTGRDERRVVLTPDSEQRGLVSTEIILKFWVKGNVGAIVENEVILLYFLCLKNQSRARRQYCSINWNLLAIIMVNYYIQMYSRH